MRWRRATQNDRERDRLTLKPITERLLSYLAAVLDLNYIGDPDPSLFPRENAFGVPHNDAPKRYSVRRASKIIRFESYSAGCPLPTLGKYGTQMEKQSGTLMG